jgi:hypothetical protein
MEWHLLMETNITGGVMINGMEGRLTFFVYFESQFRDFIITPSEIYGEKVLLYSDIIADEIYHL